MHARDLIDVAAQVAYQAPSFLKTLPPVSDKLLADYWSASRCRVDRWSMALRDYSQTLDARGEKAAARQWARIRPVLTEILLSETLTRVWAGMSAAYDYRRKSNHMEPVARAIHVAHLEARHRVLSVMVCGRGFAVQDAVALNRVRRRVESWTDALLAPIALEYDVGSLAFGEARCREFALDLAERRHDGLEEPARQLAMASLQAAFRDTESLTANPDLNAQIATAVQTCVGIQPVAFPGDRSADWLTRMQQMAEDTQSLLDELYVLEGMGQRQA